MARRRAYGRYCLTDAFPTPSRLSAVGVIRHVLFAYRAARYVQEHGANYDVIDSLLGTLPFSKKHLRFSGLLVARSVGFYRLYEKFDLLAQSRWPDLPGKFVGRILYRLVKKRAHRAAEQSVRHADLLNLANNDELASLRGTVRSPKPALVLPYGLTPPRRQALAEAALPAEARFTRKRICFIGMWTVRKGAKDWAEIIRLIRSKVPSVTFLFLGTLTDDKRVLEDLNLDGPCDFVELVREYEPETLPDLLRDSTIGLFPSYVEGFGLGVLEQLAAGIPTVAYGVPGPRQILKPIASIALTPVGDTAAMAARAVDLLQSDLPSYIRHREQSLATAARYSWPEIAEETIRAYRRPAGRTFGAVALRIRSACNRPSVAHNARSFAERAGALRQHLYLGRSSADHQSGPGSARAFAAGFWPDRKDPLCRIGCRRRAVVCGRFHSKAGRGLPAMWSHRDSFDCARWNGFPFRLSRGEETQHPVLSSGARRFCFQRERNSE